MDASLLPQGGGTVNEAPPQLYATRWWILGVFCSLSFIQASCWNFYSPVSFAVQELYGWDNNEIAWVANAANIAMLTSIPVSQLAVDRLGNRYPTVACALMMVVCAGLRCLPSLLGFSAATNRSTMMLALMVVSMVFNGWSAAWLNFAGPILSAAWFALEERATVTAIVTCMPYIGVSAGFILGPLLMEPRQFPAGCGGAAAADGSAGSGSGVDCEGAGCGCPGASTLYSLYYAEFAFTLVVLAAVLLRFPPKPPQPPTRSAALSESNADASSGTCENYRQVFCSCSQVNGALWVIAVAFALPLGVYSGWGTVLAINVTATPLCLVSDER